MSRLRSVLPVAAAFALLVPAAPALAQDGDGGGSHIPPFAVVEHYVTKVCAMADADFAYLDRQLDHLPDRVAVTLRPLVYGGEGTVEMTCRALKSVIID